MKLSEIEAMLEPLVEEDYAAMMLVCNEHGDSHKWQVKDCIWGLTQNVHLNRLRVIHLYAGIILNKIRAAGE